MERDCNELICGAPKTFQGYGIEKNRNKTDVVPFCFVLCLLVYSIHCVIHILPANCYGKF